jgi:hypothetical protein
VKILAARNLVPLVELQYKLVLRLLLHHARAVEEQARTGTQRRFREALQSLETDTPNIALLIECIDKIIFSEDRVTVRASPRKEARSENEAEPPEALATLAIDIADIKKRTSKRRLSHSGDFAYLLDALIYHLRFDGGRTVEELDRFGRNEEEQVGADDDPDEDGEQPEAKKAGRSFGALSCKGAGRHQPHERPTQCLW